MANKVIAAVHLEPQNYPGRHDHIEKVRLIDGTIEYRATVIFNIKHLADRYFTNANPPARSGCITARTATPATTSPRIPTTRRRTTC